MNNLKNHFMTIKRGITTLLKIDKTYMIVLLLISIFNPLSKYINIYMMALIIDQMVYTKKIEILVHYVLVTIILNMIITLINSGLNHLKDYHSNQFYKNEKMFLAAKTMQMDYSDIENRDINLLYERIKIESQSGYNTYYLFRFYNQAISSLVNIIASIILTYNLFFNLKILILIKLIICLLVISVIIITNFSGKKSNQINIKMYNNLVPFNALFNFYSDYFSDYNAGKDIRLYNMEEFAANQQKEQNLLTNNILLNSKQKSIKYIIINSISADIMNIATYIFVIIACLSGSISIGSITKYVTCISIFINSINSLFNQIQSLFNNNKYLKNYFMFLDIPHKMRQGLLSVKGDNDNKYEIEFHNVSFKYPGTEKYVIKNLSLKIKEGYRIALVGMNGSGKTTMIKLLCRLYDTTEGIITLNGVDIKEYEYSEYLALFSVVFQDFKLFAFNLGQNVSTQYEYDKEKVNEALLKAGFNERLYNLPNKFETTLYKDFEEDGIELSGGEAQKVALARALYKNAPFIVLDEPTAALDPIAEYEVFTRFNDIVGSKTVIFISHRLSSCRFCNIIYVFDEGKLIQQGSHESLVNNKEGKYYQLWSAQSQHYAINNT